MSSTLGRVFAVWHTGLSRPVLLLQGGTALNYFGSGLILPFEIIYLHSVRGFSTTTAGLVLATVMIVQVLAGARYSPRQHIFDAVIDKVEVKTIGELSPNEMEHDNPEIRHTDELCRWLGQLYNRDVTEEDTVTVIRFSAIKPSFGLI